MQAKLSEGFHKWVITLSIVSVAIFGNVLALICIYALPDRTVRPLAGAAYYIGSVIAVILLLLLRWKKDKEIESESVTDTPGDSRNIIEESLSDKILKWIVTFVSLLWAWHGFSMTRICIYGLPDKSTQPMAGALCFLATAGLLATFVFVIWKKIGYLKTGALLDN
jgi:hypothetical protein